MLLKILFGLVLILGLVGCATSRKEMADIKTQQLEMRIRQLERDLQQKEREIYELEDRLELTSSHTQTKVYPEKMVVVKKGDISKVTPKQIQTALKKAGFYNGPIDGKIGKNTKDAIRGFQKANGLTADGVLGRKTWAKLQKYSD